VSRFPFDALRGQFGAGDIIDPARNPVGLAEVKLGQTPLQMRRLMVTDH
jgi:hypothetical protein